MSGTCVAIPDAATGTPGQASEGCAYDTLINPPARETATPEADPLLCRAQEALAAHSIDDAGLVDCPETSMDGEHSHEMFGTTPISEELPVRTVFEPSSINEAKSEEPHAIRFTPLLDHSSAVPGRYFKPMERRLTSDGVIRIGRMDSRNSSHPDIQPLVFRSKVVSRVHAELLCKHGQWYVRDVQSSSGTFLNNSRLSPPNKASPDCKLNHGDVLQFGINFRGGHEEAFQCVKVRVELDYAWQRRVSEFNKEAHNKVREVMKAATANGQELMECSICLSAIVPGQALFISQCSHGWHYRCIRPFLVRNYPQFQCPNCRDIFDLEEEDDDEDDE